MRRTRVIVAILTAAFVTGYVVSFGAVIHVGCLTYLDVSYDPALPKRGYYFADDPLFNRYLYYFYYPLAKCYGWVANAAFLEENPLISENLGNLGTFPNGMKIRHGPIPDKGLSRAAVGPVAAIVLFGAAFGGERGPPRGL